MSLTPSTMLALGTVAPDFTLPHVATDQPVSLSDCAGKQGTVIVFLCAHCPYVIHVKDELAQLARDYSACGIGFVGISSNDVANYPEDSPIGLAHFAEEAEIGFPLLYDASQDVAHAYTAACTPDFFLFDAARTLVYRGQLDASRPGQGQPDGRDLRAALEALLAGQPIDSQQLPSTGCNIKWKPGNAPAS